MSAKNTYKIAKEAIKYFKELSKKLYIAPDKIKIVFISFNSFHVNFIF